MKVVFYEPYSISSPHFETCLELIQKHIDAEDEITLYYCNRALKSCYFNETNDYIKCLECKIRRKSGLDLLNTHKNKIKIKDFANLTFAQKKYIKSLTYDFNSIEDLKNFEFDGIDIGLAVASSLISYLRDPKPDMTLSKGVVNNLIRSSLTVYFSFLNIFTISKPDKIFLFNGRFAEIRPVVRLCEKMNINYFIHERGFTKDKYNLYNNYLPHDMEMVQSEIIANWDKSDNINNKIEDAEKFYFQRKNGIEQGWISFIKNQDLSLLPSDWNKSIRNVVIFNSSEDEFASITNKVMYHPFNNQMEGLFFISSYFKSDSDINFYLRVHPNLTGIKNSSTNFEILSNNNFKIISPESSISTYELIDNCDLVITFGSTVGIEATFWRKPSILIGNSFYDSLNSTFNVQDKELLVNYIKHIKSPAPISGALMYGYYFHTHGNIYKFYQAENLFNGKFKGKEIVKSNIFFKYYVYILRNKYLKKVRKKITDRLSFI